MDQQDSNYHPQSVSAGKTNAYQLSHRVAYTLHSGHSFFGVWSFLPDACSLGHKQSNFLKVPGNRRCRADVMRGPQPAGATRVMQTATLPAGLAFQLQSTAACLHHNGSPTYWSHASNFGSHHTTPTGLTPEKWKQTATLCPVDEPSNYSVLRLWHTKIPPVYRTTQAANNAAPSHGFALGNQSHQVCKWGTLSATSSLCSRGATCARTGIFRSAVTQENAESG